MKNINYDLVIIGGGFTGLAIAHRALKDNLTCLIVEQNANLGGLASSFDFSDGTKAEKFYHHWFKSDSAALDLISDLGLKNQLMIKSTITSLLYKGTNWRLTKPIDVLKFTQLKFKSRMMLGVLLVRARLLKYSENIERETAKDWLIRMGGKEVYEVVWRPLIEGKFGEYANELSAVWIWKKLQLRGGSRNLRGEEQLVYFKGGFITLVNEWTDWLQRNGCHIKVNTKISRINFHRGNISSVTDSDGLEYKGKNFIFTTDTHSLAAMLPSDLPPEVRSWQKRLNEIVYLGNICLVLQTSKRISNSYWTNINDPGFPFVGFIEHTNLDNEENYSGTHISYLSQYLAHKNKNWNLGDLEYFKMASRKMLQAFPDFEESSILDFRVHRTKYAQPLMTVGYKEKIPSQRTPFSNGFLCTMAQIYPEDRGTNYSIEYANRFYQEIYSGKPKK